MKELPVTEIARITGARVVGAARGPGGGRLVAASVSTDSRSIVRGDCFFAIVGGNFDGHDFVSEAFEKGAACAVVSKAECAGRLTGRALLVVEDTVKALGDLARECRRRAGFKVVAITGSVGKTTTREIAYHALSRRLRVHRSPRSFNNAIGLPLTLLSAAERDELVIAELGSSRPGEIAYLTGIAQPDVAVVTNVRPAHLAGFGSLEAILAEKLSIGEGLTEHGELIINADIPELVAAAGRKYQGFTSFGKSDRAEHRATDITADGLGSRFRIGRTEVRLPLPGPGNVENALAAWAICRRFGLSVEEFADAMETLPAVAMRAELLRVGTLTVVNDCYNANPASMENALSILRSLEPSGGGRRVFICGDMAELGAASEELHARLGASIAAAGVKLLITVGRLAAGAAEAARKAAQHDLDVKSFDEVRPACDNLHGLVKDYDIVLVKGSRSARLEAAVERLKELFGRPETPRQGAAAGAGRPDERRNEK